MSANPDTFRRRFLKKICQHDYLLYLAFIFEVMFLVVAVLSLLYADLDEATQTILILDFVLLGGLLVGTVGLIYGCKKWVLTDD